MNSSNNLTNPIVFKLMTKKYKIYYAEANYGKSEIDAVFKVLHKQKHFLMGGNQTKILENKVSKLFNKKYGLMTNSGSSSNLLALASFQFIKGSEIITPALTFSTTVSPIVQNGLIPAFVDIDIKTLQIDTKLIEKAINKIESKKIPLNTKVASNPSILMIVDKGMAKIPKGPPLKKDVKGRMPGDPHHGHNH